MSKRTPYDDKYPSCERTDVSLLIYPGALDPHEVSKILGLTPTRVNRKGETRTDSLGRSRVVSKSGWFLSTEGRVDSLDTRRHLDWLLDRLEPIQEGLKSLQETVGVVMSVSCVWWSVQGHGGPTLWPEQMRRLADLDLECTFDVYFFGEDE